MSDTDTAEDSDCIESPKPTWTVRSSKERDADGRFQHYLCYKGRVVTKGIGADSHRTFTTQAEFFNERGLAPVEPKCLADLPRPKNAIERKF